MDILGLLNLCVSRDASDLHLSVGLPPMLRIDGDLKRLDGPTLSTDDMLVALNALSAADQEAAASLHRFRKEAPCGSGVDFSVAIPEVARFRVNAFRQSRGLAAVFRTVPATVPTLDSLRLAPIFKTIASERHGLVIVTGATGSGKSTTLAAMVDHVNGSTRQHILTVEDPIEFVHAARSCLVTQRQIGRDCADFASALRAALRQDPDVILIGEMRDRETISLALTAAETGHLVLATLHAPSAASAVDRIVDVFPGADKNAARTLLADSLQAVVAQRLVRRKSGGRTALHEIMLATPAVRNLIRENKGPQLYSTIQSSGSVGMQTFDQCAQRLVEAGEVDPSVAAPTPSRVSQAGFARR